MCYTTTAKTHTGKRKWVRVMVAEVNFFQSVIKWLVCLGREEPADVPGVHGCLFLLCCFVVLHVVMALFNPSANVPCWVSHYVFNCGVVDERLEERVFCGFVEYPLYGGSELGSVGLC